MKKISLTPFGKTQYFAANFARLILNSICLPFAILYSLARALTHRTIALFSAAPKLLPPKKGEIAIDPTALPQHRGFADSDFQAWGVGLPDYSPSGLKGECSFDKEWLKKVGGTEDGDPRRFFTDVLNDPQPFIDILLKMNCTSYRFSVGGLWTAEEGYDPKAVALYQNFVRLLSKNGIIPYLTVHHFVPPKWFQEKGGFEKPENIQFFERHALKLMGEVFPEVDHWILFNEINVDAFQKYVRGVYPPGREGDLAAAGRVMAHMLAAHCKVYKAAKEKWPRLQIGSSHQWLKFEPLNGNPVEQLACYFLSKITHYACYNFWKTGQFSLEIPGKANVQFSIPEEEFKKYNGFSDRMDAQFYGIIRLMAGFNGGHVYPGYETKNFNCGKLGVTFGSTSPKGGEVMRFGPSVYPESLETCLEELYALKKPFGFSEIGCDATIQKDGEKDFRINHEAQKRCFEKMFQVFTRHKDQLKKWMKHIKIWTPFYPQLEWELKAPRDVQNGSKQSAPCLGVMKIIKDKNSKIVGHDLFPSAILIQAVYGQAKAAAA